MRSETLATHMHLHRTYIATSLVTWLSRREVRSFRTFRIVCTRNDTHVLITFPRHSHTQKALEVPLFSFSYTCVCNTSKSLTGKNLYHYYEVSFLRSFASFLLNFQSSSLLERNRFFLSSTMFNLVFYFYSLY